MNDIALNGFTDLVNALHRNTTLLYLPTMQESRQMALKRTEDQVKQLRDDASVHNMKSLSVRSKLANKASKVTSKTSRDRGASIGLSDQDIKAALGLVDESWSRQEYRLQQYLQRNHNIANNIPVSMDVGDEDFERDGERPDTASSLMKAIEKVTLDSTPTLEKEIQLGTVTAGSLYESPESTPGSTPGLRMAKGRTEHTSHSSNKVDYFGAFSESLDNTPDGSPGVGEKEKDIQMERVLGGNNRLSLNYEVTSLEREIEMSFQ